MDGWIYEMVFFFSLAPKKSLFFRLVPKKSFFFRLVPENSPILSVWQIHSGHTGLLQVNRLLTFCDPCQQFKES